MKRWLWSVGLAIGLLGVAVGHAQAPAQGKGLKHAIGCTDFENQAGWRGQWELGSNLASMLEYALGETDQFVVVDRQQLGRVLAEQDLAASGRSAPSRQVAQRGLLRPARYLARGTVTEVQEAQSGGSGGVRIRGVRIGGGRSQAQITVLVSLVDTTTGEIVAQERITGHAGRTRLRLGLSARGFSGDVEGFSRTPLGEAAQDCISQAAELIAQKMSDFPFEGAVVTVSQSGQIVINRGSEFGVEPGQDLVMAEEGEMLLDPDTGALLGRDEGRVIGRLRVARVQEKISFCDVVEGESSPAVGTRVTLAHR